MRTLLIATLLLAGCAGGPENDAAEDATPGAELTQRQRDSIFGESSMPGAKSVKRAFDASNAAEARAARLDSILN